MKISQKGKLGKIYILRNSALKDGILKIGLTERESEIRANEISSTTGVPLQYEVLYEDEVLDAIVAERLIHQKLGKYRLNPRREFFKLPPKLAVKTVFEVCMEINKIVTGQIADKIGIIINSKSLTEDQLRTLRQIILKEKGQKIKVFLILKSKNSTTVISLPETYNVNISTQLLGEIKHISFVEDVIWKATPTTLANHSLKKTE